MNLMDISTKDWHKTACAVAGAGVEGMLGPSPVPGHTIVGPVRPRHSPTTPPRLPSGPAPSIYTSAARCNSCAADMSRAGR